ncbi:MAG TPA: (d)CMP kinase [Chitinispirillaceae bacterium]|nr:(d)CMP kinase [Chitinispirillaceae bacterium]
MIIAIDGPAGSGKSSTAKAVASRLKITFLDTGAMYRAITLKCLREGVAASDESALAGIISNTRIDFEGVPPDMRVLLDGEDITEAIRGEDVTANVSDYCVPVVVREELVRQQREIGHKGSVVCEGRDIGTVVFPDADLKFFMVASVQERARRRQKDFELLGIKKTLEELEKEISLRDYKDSSRKISPLKKADDAVEMDTTGMTLEQQIELIVNAAEKFINN